MNNLNDFDKFQAWMVTKLRTDDPTYPFYESTYGLAGETGEVLEIVKKALRRGKGPKFTPEEEAKLVLEIGDVVHYCAMLSDWLGYDFSEIINKNIEKIDERFPT